MTISTADHRLEEALACVDVFYARMFRDWPTAINLTMPDYTLSYSGDNRLTGANHLWLHHPGALTDSVLDAATRFFDPLGAAWSVIITDTHIPNGEDFLEDRGFFVRWGSPLMVLDSPPRPAPADPSLPVIRATTPQHIDAMWQVMSEAFATNRSVNERVARAAHLNDPDIDHYLIYAGDDPAACATVTRHGSMAGVWNVGTRHRYRRQRFATTVMRVLIAHQAAHGYPRSMLMASPAGKPLYMQLGYREIGYTLYLGPPYVASRIVS